MEKNKIDYKVKLTYDEKRNSIIYKGKKVTLYDAFRLVTPMSNHTPKNIEALQNMIPGMSIFQLEKLLYCCASRFCCSDTNDEILSPMFSVCSNDFNEEQYKEIRQLVEWGCLTEQYETKPITPHSQTLWPSWRYHLDWNFLRYLKNAEYGKLYLTHINEIEPFEKFIHYNNRREYLYLDDETEPIDILKAFHICRNIPRYKNLENIAIIHSMFPQLSEYQFNVLVLFINNRKYEKNKEYNGEELIKTVPPFEMHEGEKENEIYRLYYLDVISCLFVSSNIRENKYELSDCFFEKIQKSGYKKVELKTDCQIGNIIFPNEIKNSCLFYNSDVLHSLEEIKVYMHDKNYKKLQEHFQKEVGHLSFTCLLEGPSGTGKTAFVKELARCTDRPILFIDIAKMRGGHWGDDEKRTRAIFEEYLFRSCTMPIQPILFVDECDTMLTCRQNPDGDINSSLVNGLNTVVEIWLQELDKFDGILFLTTNNVNHMDEAIARRLTFQIHIGHPDNEIQVKLWKHYFPNINETEAKIMAHETNFSGGQIVNVKKKMQFKEILFGPVSFAELQQACSTNSNIKKRNLIGFYK